MDFVAPLLSSRKTLTHDNVAPSGLFCSEHAVLWLTSPCLVRRYQNIYNDAIRGSKLYFQQFTRSNSAPETSCSLPLLTSDSDDGKKERVLTVVKAECHGGGWVTEGTAFRKLLTIASTKRKVKRICHQLMTGSRRCWEAVIKADPLTLPAVAWPADLPADRMITPL